MSPGAGRTPFTWEISFPHSSDKSESSALLAPAACQIISIQSKRYVFVGYFGAAYFRHKNLAFPLTCHQDFKMNMIGTAPTLAYPTSVNGTNMPPIDQVSYWESLTHIWPPRSNYQTLKNKTQAHYSFPSLLLSTLFRSTRTHISRPRLLQKLLKRVFLKGKLSQLLPTRLCPRAFNLHQNLRSGRRPRPSLSAFFFTWASELRRPSRTQRRSEKRRYNCRPLRTAQSQKRRYCKRLTTLLGGTAFYKPDRDSLRFLFPVGAEPWVSGALCWGQGKGSELYPVPSFLAAKLGVWVP